MCSAVRSTFSRSQRVKDSDPCTNIRRRGPDGCYYFRTRIPPSLIHALRVKELRFSLRTKVLAHAIARADVVRERLNAVFSMGWANVLTDQQIRDLLVEYVEHDLKRDEEKRAGGWDLQESVADPGDDLDSYRERIAILCEALIHADRQQTLGGEYADFILRTSGLSEPKSSPGYLKLAREALKAQLEIVETQLARFQGDYTTPHDARFSYLADALPQKQVRATTDSPMDCAAPAGPLLSEVIERYVRECGVKDRWTEKTTRENRAIFSILVGCLGDRPVTSLTREDIVGVLDQIKRLPPNSTKVYPGKSVKQILDAPDLSSHESLAVSSVQKYMRRISSLFKYAHRAEIIQRHIAEGVNLSSANRDYEAREIYLPEDIKRMFDELPNWASRGVKFQLERFWIPLVGLYTGMRLNEICQLHVADLRDLGGTWCFDVNEETDDKRLKTRAGKRCVPLHPVLVEVGLLEHWQRMKDQKQERLWPGLKLGRDGYGQDFSKRFGSFNRKYVTKDRKKVFHSFRHTLANRLKQQGCEEALICQILGHEYAGSESMVRYGKQYNPTVLLAALRKIDFGLNVVDLRQFAVSP
jgi:integrase